MRGNARFLDSNTLFVDGNESSRSLKVTAEHFIIATGSRPQALDEITVDGSFIMTSDNIYDGSNVFSQEYGDSWCWSGRL